MLIFQFEVSDFSAAKFINESFDLTRSFGDEEQIISFSTPEDGSFAAVSFDYRFFARAGFVGNFQLNAGDVDIVSPLIFDVENAVTTLSDGTIQIDTSRISFGESLLVSSGLNYSINLDFLVEFLFETSNELYQFFPNGEEPTNFSRPEIQDFVFTQEFDNELRSSILSLNSGDPLPLFSGNTEQFGLDVVIPAGVPAISGDPDDFLLGGGIIADSVTDPFLSANIDIAGLIGDQLARRNLVFAVLSEILDGITVPGVPILGNVTINPDLFSLGLVGNLRIAQEYTFTPGDIDITIVNLTTNEAKLGTAGDVLSFMAAPNGQDSQFAISIDLEGDLRSRFGILPDLDIPFSLFEATIEASNFDEPITLGPVLSGNLAGNNINGEPFYLIDESRAVDFEAQTLTFSVDAIDENLPKILTPLAIDATEGQTIFFTVSLSEVANQDITIPFQILGLNTEPGDFFVNDLSVTILSGQSQGVIPVLTDVDDDQDDESIQLVLGNPLGAIFGGSNVAEATIIDNGQTGLPLQPTIIAFDDDVTIEGDTLTLSVFLNQNAENPVTINYSIIGGTANSADFFPISGQISIDSGQNSGLIEITTRDDTAVELNETIDVRLTSSTGAALPAQFQATGTIQDNDIPLPALPTITTVRSDRAREGDPLRFEIILDSPAPADVDIEFQLASVTAEISDFANVSGFTTIPAGSNSVFISVPTEVDDDGDDERILLEVVSVTGGNQGSDNNGTGDILDTFQAPLARPNIVAINDVEGSEGDLLLFNVTLDGPSRNDVVIQYSLNNLTSENGDVLSQDNFRIVIPRGASSGVISIQAGQDQDFRDEIFQLNLFDIIGTNGMDVTSALGTIIDDDVEDGIVVEVGVAGDGRFNEGDEVVFTIGLENNPRNREVIVTYHIEGVTATNGVDFLDNIPSREISLRRDDVTNTIRIPTISNGFVENDETLRLVIDSITGGVADNSVVVATIVDTSTEDQQAPIVQIGSFNNTVVEGGILRLPLGAQLDQFTTDVVVEFEIVGDFDATDIESITVVDFRPNSFGDVQRFTTVFTNTATAQVFLDASLREQATRSFDILVDFKDDLIFEGDRAGIVVANVISGNARINDFVPRITVFENDSPPPPVASIFSSAAFEGDVIRIPVQLDRPTEETISIGFVVEVGDTEGDLVNLTGIVEFEVGESIAFIEIGTREDILEESNERFFVLLTTVVTGDVIFGERVSADGVIIDEDFDPFTSGNDFVRLVDGEGGNVLNGLAGDDIIFGRADSENISGGGGADQIFGGDGFDTLFGNDGNDKINGDRQNDILNGGIGNDSLNGGLGRDSLLGGDGNDLLLGGNRQDTLDGGIGNDRVFGGNGNDIISGSSGKDILRGGANEDTLIGGAGNDFLFGGTGIDILQGGADNDQLSGRGGFDTLNGGAGNDTITGGFNADTFVFEGGFGQDVIVDFAALSNPEKIDLSGVDSITSFVDLVNNHLISSGMDALIADGLGNTITLLGVDINDLDTNDFIF